MADKLQIFTAPGCGGCKEVKDAMDSGRLDVQGVDVKPEEIEVVDLSSDEGYAFIDTLGLGNVPAAYYGGEKCELLVDDETKRVTVKCGEPSTGEP